MMISMLPYFLSFYFSSPSSSPVSSHLSILLELVSSGLFHPEAHPNPEGRHHPDHQQTTAKQQQLQKMLEEN